MTFLVPPSANAAKPLRDEPFRQPQHAGQCQAQCSRAEMPHPGAAGVHTMTDPRIQHEADKTLKDARDHQAEKTGPGCVGVRLPMRITEDAKSEEQGGERWHDDVAHPTRQIGNASKEVHAASSATSSKRPDARERKNKAASVGMMTLPIQLLRLVMPVRKFM